MPNQKPGVDADMALQPIQPVTERGPPPVQPGPQRVQRHAFHARQHPGEVVLLLSGGGRQRKPAITTEDRGDAVLHRRAGGRVPKQLRVVVGVQVNKTWRKRQTLRINSFRGQLIDVTDRGDQPILNADGAAPSWRPSAVDDVGVADEQV